VEWFTNWYWDYGFIISIIIATALGFISGYYTCTKKIENATHKENLRVAITNTNV